MIPDYAVRMAILDFENFPSGEEERAALLRFRLRKSVPFHIEEAQLAYSVQLQEPKRIEVLTVAIARPILRRIRSDLHCGGLPCGTGYALCHRGPDGFARDSEEGLTLVAKAAGSTLSVLLLDKARLRLVRCLDLTAGEDEERSREDQTVLPFLQQTLAYAEDQLGQPARRLLLCGFGAETERLGMRAQKEFGIPYAPVRSKFGAATQENAGLLGLLEQYAA